MFSIENLLEEVIRFIKRFFSTFYLVVCQPVKTLRNILLLQKEIGINPFLYFLISLSLLFSFQFINDIWVGMDASDLIKNYGQNVSKTSLSDRLFYIIVIGGISYLFIKSISSLLRNNKRNQNAFEMYSFYWLGSSSLLFIISNLLIKLIDIYFFYSTVFHKISAEGLFSFLYTMLNIIWAILAFVLPLIAVAEETYHRKKTFWIYLIIPVISAFAVPTTQAMVLTTIKLFSLKGNQRINITDIRGEDKFAFFMDTLQQDPSVISIKFDGIIKNNSESNFIIDTSTDIKIIDTTLSPDPESTLKNQEFGFKILSLNGNILQGASILKPYEISTICLVSIVDKKVLDKFLPKTAITGMRQGNLILEYSFSDLNRKGTSYSSEKKVEVCSITKAGLENVMTIMKIVFGGKMDTSKLKAIIDTSYTNRK